MMKRAFTRSNPENRLQAARNERFGLFARLIPYSILGKSVDLTTIDRVAFLSRKGHS